MKDMDSFVDEVKDGSQPPSGPTMAPKTIPNRDDFSEKTKRVIADRVNGRCSHPECDAPTRGPKEDPDGAINLGEAAHITAAAPGGPRYDPALTPAQRRHQNNGIWMCRTHAKLVDNDITRFAAKQLRSWKKDAEARAKQHAGKPAEDQTALREVRSLGAQLLGPEHHRATAMADALRQTLERMNPGLSATITFGKNTRQYAFRFKDGITSMNAVDLTFPDTSAGRRGREKLQRVFDLGVSETILPDEATATIALRTPEYEPGTPGTLTIGPTQPRPSYDVRIDATIDGKRQTLIPHTTLTVVRAGRKEMEISIAGGTFAGSWHFVIPEATRRSTTHLTISLPGVTARAALNTVNLAHALMKGERVTIVPHDPKWPSLPTEADQPEILRPFLEHWHDFLINLVQISDEYGKELVCPDQPDEETVLIAWTLATAIREGEVITVPDAPLALTTDRPVIDALIRCWRENGHAVVDQSTDETVHLLGHDLPVGTVKHTYADITPEDTQITEASAGKPVMVNVRFVRDRYTRWYQERRHREP